MAILDSLVIELSEEEAADAAVIDYDHQGNLYDSGETTTTFYAGEPIDLLVQLPIGFLINNIKLSSGGSVNYGIVQRQLTVDDAFFPDDKEIALKWRPLSIPTITNVHGQFPVPTISMIDGKLTCDRPPAVLDYSYSFEAYSIQVSHPAGLTLSEDEEYPVGMYIEVTR